MGEVFFDAFLDTLKVLPFLLIMNFIIEFSELKTNGFKANKMLKGGVAPLVGTMVGMVPQCGFSVVATELYGKRKIALGTLLAVYIATSDEALPIMLSSYDGIVKVLPIIIIKICFALTVGYIAFIAEKFIVKHKHKCDDNHIDGNAEHTDADSETHAEHMDERDVEIHAHGCHNHSLESAKTLPADATKKQKAAYFYDVYLKHPLLHTVTVVFYIFAVNVVFGIIVYYVGEERLATFIGKSGYLQPLLAGAVGLIPNCAASVVITELYIVDGLNLGGAVAGLCVSAGIGYAVLAKRNRSVSNTVAIVVGMYIISVALGVIVNVVAPTV